MKMRSGGDFVSWYAAKDTIFTLLTFFSDEDQLGFSIDFSVECRQKTNNIANKQDT